MNPIPIPDEVAETYPDSQTVVFGPPAGVPDEECGTTEVLVAPYVMGGDVTRVHHAYFRPTADELAVLNEGGLLEVSQVGNVLLPFAANVITVPHLDRDPDQPDSCGLCGQTHERSCVTDVERPQPSEEDR